MGKFKQETLENKTVAELRSMCVNMGIVGMSKKRKAIIIDAILGKTGGPVASKSSKGIMSSKTPIDNGEPARDEGVNGLDFSMHSELTKPNAQMGNKTTTTIRVSCGASSGNFPVVGKTVGEVSEYLREVLNVSRMASGVIDGKPVDGDYVLGAENKTLEFLKPAGKKG